MKKVSTAEKINDMNLSGVKLPENNSDASKCNIRDLQKLIVEYACSEIIVTVIYDNSPHCQLVLWLLIGDTTHASFNFESINQIKALFLYKISYNSF